MIETDSEGRFKEMCIYGCCRISTNKQSIERQERNILTIYPDAIIIKEVYTGTKLEGRKEFEQLIQKVKAGDKIVFDSVSRMSRDADKGFQLYQELYNRGVELEFINEPHINTATYREAANRQIDGVETGDEATNELMAGITEAINRYIMRLAERQIMIAFEQAAKEVKDLHIRTAQGIETARLAGKQIGQKQGAKLKVKKADPTKEMIIKYSKDFNGTLSDVEVMKLVGVARNTYYKYKKELKEA